MYTFPGGSVRQALLAAIATLTLSLSACSDAKPPLPDAKNTSAADGAAVDEKALTKLATDLWKARTESQNNGNTSSEQFEGLLSLPVTEAELGMLQSYKKDKFLRSGAPAITAIETSVSGDSGEILLCVNEDRWTVEVDGKPAEVAKYGSRPWAATAERIADRWIITEIVEPVAAAKTKEKRC